MPFSIKKAKSLIVLFSLIFIQLVFISIQVPMGDESNYFERIVFSVFSPINSGVVSVFRGIGSIWKNYFGLHKVQKDNQRLQKEVFRLNQQNSLFRSMLRTYKKEKEMLDRVIELEGSILPVRVIGLDASNIWKSLVINKGSIDGVKKDMVVLDKQGNLVGRIVEPVALKQARIQMITDTESGVHVIPQGKNVPAIINGIGNGLCTLEYVHATDTLITEGDNLITTGIDGIYMPGVLVGRVVSVAENISLFKEIKVEPAFRIQNLDILAVIKADVNELF
ncbi:MAG: rod shape-determining protein MreC [Candidatus Aminicenantes bacterium]|nr:MAG: rod shape-determining protein MreC [Candidatus Aminicenantes bacterium]